MPEKNINPSTSEVRVLAPRESRQCPSTTPVAASLISKIKAAPLLAYETSIATIRTVDVDSGHIYYPTLIVTVLSLFTVIICLAGGFGQGAR